MSVDPSSYDEPIDFDAAMALLPERMVAKIGLAETGCWLWTGEIDRYGYGCFGIGSKADGTRRKAKAHRVTYAALRGEIPAGLLTDHVCHTVAVDAGGCPGGNACLHRRCCNPWHLEMVTNRENMMRGMTVTAANAAKTHCPQGHPLSGDNLYVPPAGGRYCRTCRAAADRRWLQRKRTA